jgi:hypothetical protein
MASPSLKNAGKKNVSTGHKPSQEHASDHGVHAHRSDGLLDPKTRRALLLAWPRHRTIGCLPGPIGPQHRLSSQGQLFNGPAIPLQVPQGRGRHAQSGCQQQWLLVARVIDGDDAKRLSLGIRLGIRLSIRQYQSLPNLGPQTMFAIRPGICCVGQTIEATPPVFLLGDARVRRARDAARVLCNPAGCCAGLSGWNAHG